MSFPDASMDWYLQAKEMLVEAGASPQAAVLGGATIAGFFAAACRCDRERRLQWILVSLRIASPLKLTCLLRLRCHDSLLFPMSTAEWSVWEFDAS